MGKLKKLPRGIIVMSAAGLLAGCDCLPAALHSQTLTRRASEAQKEFLACASGWYSVPGSALGRNEPEAPASLLRPGQCWSARPWRTGTADRVSICNAGHPRAWVTYKRRARNRTAQSRAAEAVSVSYK